MRETKSIKPRAVLLRLISLCVAFVLISALCIGTAADTARIADGRAGGAKVYLRDGGTGDGSSAEQPLGTIAQAYDALGDEGGRIIVCGTYTMTGPFYAPAHTGAITVTQKDAATDYSTVGSFSTGGTGRRYTLGGDTCFEHIRFTTENKGGLILMAHYNHVELGEGVVCEGFDGASTGSALSLLGGRNSGVTPVRAPDGGAHITVRSGSGILIAGMDRQVEATNPRVSYIDIYGGEICNLYGGNINKGTNRGSVINISGGVFSGNVQFGLKQYEYTKVNISGGDFSAVAKLEGLAPYAELTVSKDIYTQISAKLESFSRVLISTGELLDNEPGDVDGDLYVTNADMTALVRVLSRSESVLGQADVNRDGRINNRDAICLVQTLAGWIICDRFPELEGEGTAESPYLIGSAADLEYLSDRVLGYESTRGVCFRQTQDIMLDSSRSWTPIGTSGVPFEGSYDGGGFRVEGMYINTDRSYAGLFGFITGTVERVDVYGSITVHRDASHSHSFAGGVVGAMNNGALVRGCNSYVSITGDSYVGGVVGGVACVDDYRTTEVSRIVDCTFRGELTADGKYSKNESAMYFGGIVGRVHGSVEGCRNYGSVTVVGTNCRYIGGIAGFIYYSHKFLIPKESEGVRVSNCENYGAVTGHRETGGIVGAGSIPIINCTNNAPVTGVRCVGGIVGVAGTAATSEHGYSYTEGCKNTATVTLTQQYGGGIAGYSYYDIKGCTNSGKVQGGTSRTGSISGYMDGGKIS